MLKKGKSILAKSDDQRKARYLLLLIKIPILSNEKHCKAYQMVI